MLKVDLHTHTVGCGHAYSTIMENAQAAKAKGIKILGIADHGPAVDGAAKEIFFRAHKHIPEEIGKVRILFGVEANIIDTEGKLDISDQTLEKMDIVIAGLHTEAGFYDIGREENTQAVVAAIKNPRVHMISHPYTMDYDLDIEDIAEAACKYNKLLEINSSYFYKPIRDFDRTLNRIKRMVKVLKANKKKPVVNSDSHIATNVGRFEELEAYYEELGLEESDIFNSNVRAVKKYFGLK